MSDIDLPENIQSEYQVEDDGSEYEEGVRQRMAERYESERELAHE